MWLCKATIWMPDLRNARNTGCTSSARMMKSPSIAASWSLPLKAAQVVRPIEAPIVSSRMWPVAPMVIFGEPLLASTGWSTI